MVAPSNHTLKPLDPAHPASGFRFLYFSELQKRPVCAGKIKDRIGKLTDLVFRLAEPYPEAIGLYLEHGWGKPTEFIPWNRVLKLEDDAIFVQPPPEGNAYPPFKDETGWILLDKHLIGRTILDMDGRRVEVVNDAHLLESGGRMVMVHVDVSFNGFLRALGLGRLSWIKDQLISWKYVQPLSVEDAVATDKVSLSVTRKQLRELPGEDLADALEELSGQEQQALFSALDSEKAAETLLEAEPRAKRQLIANLRQERARTILSEMSVPQLVDLFSVLPHDHMMEMARLLPQELSDRVLAILSEREATARALMSPDFVAVPKEARVGEVLASLRQSKREPESISSIYVMNALGGGEQILAGVVDLRELVLAPDAASLGEIMVAPVVSAEEDDVLDDLAELFAKYQYRMLPVVDKQDHLLGVIYYNDIMKGLLTHAKI